MEFLLQVVQKQNNLIEKHRYARTK